MSNLPHRAISVALEIVRRFRNERCSQIAASLAFTTLLSLVPLLALALAVVSQLPVSARLGAALQQFLLQNLLPEKAGVVIANYVLQFSHKAGRLTIAGSALLVATAFVLMLTIEHAFNALWRVARRRRLVHRLFIHAMVLILGPALLGASLAATTFVVTTSLGWVDEPAWVRTVLGRLLPGLFLAGLCSLLFFAVPNRPVRLRHAAAGGVVAALGLLLLQRLFSLYVVRFPDYNLLYGAFAVIPIFLVWLHLCWSVVLIGALVTATLPDAGGRIGRGAPSARTSS
jgi:membrane protein